MKEKNFWLSIMKEEGRFRAYFYDYTSITHKGEWQDTAVDAVNSLIANAKDSIEADMKKL